MKQNSIFNIQNSSSNGFTFVEILVVMAIITFMAGIGFFLSSDVFRSSSFSSDTDSLGIALQRARSQAINNIDEKPHGIKITGGDYIIFEGISYASRDTSKDETIKGNSTFTFTGPTEVVFTQLSGQCSLCGDIVINDGSRTATILLNFEGRIDF